MQKDRNTSGDQWTRRTRLCLGTAPVDGFAAAAAIADPGAEVSGGRPYVEALARVLPGAIYRAEPGRHVIMLPCRRCPRPVEAFTSPNHIPPEQIPQKLRARGWQVGRTAAKHQCPSHVKEKPMPPASPAAAAPVPTPDARAARRAAMDWLGESFDLTAGRYSPGVTDATIAREVGMSEAAVAQLREEFFGPLREPSEIEAVRIELGKIAQDAELLARNFNDTSDRLSADIRALNRRLDGLVQSNGWKP